MQTAKKSILLIQAGADQAMQEAWGDGEQAVFGHVDFDDQTGEVRYKYYTTPIAVSTLAALTPEGYDVDLWDENLQGPIRATTELPRAHYDLVGISAMFSYLEPRLRTLATLFRERGAYVCAGGPCVSSAPHKFRDVVDSLFVNESEQTWPEFLGDWTQAAAKPEYIQVAKPDMATSPPPRWESLSGRIRDYYFGTVQTTRGCPFDCEFCDVIYLYGRTQRHKPVDNVIAEVSTLQRLGAKRVFFTDDEFVGNPRYAKELLRALIPVNNAFPQPLSFLTQLTLNLSRDDELLELVADVNFHSLLVGIESLNEEALRETNKVQNLRRDIIADVHKILSHGVSVNGSFIVGFDVDGPESFSGLIDGIRRGLFPVVFVGRMRAMFGTKLWARLREENRLVKLRTSASIPLGLNVDIMPKRMSRVEFLEGWRSVIEAVYRVDAMCERLRGWVSMVTRPPRVRERIPSLDFCVRLFRSLQGKMGLSDADLREVEGTLEHTHTVAPFMVPKVLTAMFRNDFARRYRAFFTEEQFRDVIEQEKKGDLVPDATPIVMPRSFEAPFRRDLFPAVYARLARNLGDAKLIPNAASEVFVDFLVRWSGELGNDAEPAGASGRYLEYLRQLCDRSAAKITGQTPEAFVPAGEETSIPPGFLKKSGLADAVLKEVADRLRSLATARGAGP
jgi:radical SAM superfamily enzyme YgiQ (UPF0313 family)